MSMFIRVKYEMCKKYLIYVIKQLTFNSLNNRILYINLHQLFFISLKERRAGLAQSF